MAITHPYLKHCLASLDVAKQRVAALQTEVTNATQEAALEVSDYKIGDRLFYAHRHYPDAEWVVSNIIGGIKDDTVYVMGYAITWDGITEYVYYDMQGRLS